MIDEGAPRCGRRGWPAGVLLALAVAPVCAAWLAPPRPLYAQAPDPVPVAVAYTAAWNAHDLPAVLALFAPDAVVRERRETVPPHVWDTRDPQVVRAYLDTASDGTSYNPNNLVWVTGHQEIAMWAAGQFKQHHRYMVSPYRAAADTVEWSYREFVDPFQLVQGISPAEGAAEAVVHGGRITVLTLVESPASVARRRSEAGAALDLVVAIRRAASLGAGPRLPLSGPPRAVAEPAPVAWPLALGGLALLAAVTLARRRRWRP